MCNIGLSLKGNWRNKKMEKRRIITKSYFSNFINYNLCKELYTKKGSKEGDVQEENEDKKIEI